MFTETQSITPSAAQHNSSIPHPLWLSVSGSAPGGPAAPSNAEAKRFLQALTSRAALEEWLATQTVFTGEEMALLREVAGEGAGEGAKAQEKVAVGTQTPSARAEEEEASKVGSRGLMTPAETAGRD